MRLFYRLSADVIWLIHFLVVVLLLFGWLMPSIWYAYMIALVLTLISELVWSYCILSKWEFDLRKKGDPTLDYDFSYASYYTYRLTQGYFSPRFLAYAGIVFTSVSLLINLYFKLIQI